MWKRAYSEKSQQTKGLVLEMKINIYSPTYYRLENTVEFVASLKESVARSRHDAKIFIADNNSPTEMKKYLMGQNDDNVEVHLFEKNYGKGHAINTLHNNVRKSELVLSIDSDIICKDGANWIDRMVSVLVDNSDIGIISARFQEGVSHNYALLKKRMTVRNSNLIYGSTQIGGACIMLRSETWDKARGYNAPDIYAGDDGTLINHVYHRQKKKVVVCTNIILYHLDENDDKYRAWKINRMRNRKSHDKKPDSGYYENL